jgi:hypothetical protein
MEIIFPIARNSSPRLVHAADLTSKMEDRKFVDITV